MRWAAALRAAAAALVLSGALTCCSSTPAGPAAGTSPPRPTVAATELQWVQRAVDSFNAGAGGPVSGQQTALAALLDSGQRSVQSACSAATTTLRFEPVYGRLAAAPGWRPGKGTLSGTVYAVPTLIRIYLGNRITGTDLTDLHVSVHAGRAWLPALCLG
jgi:hypothetical protein